MESRSQRCWRCQGLGLCLESQQYGYTTYIQCRVCKGTGEMPRKEPE